MNLIQLGHFVLNSGKTSYFKLECDKFIEENAEGLAYLLSKIAGPYSTVEGIPRGGNLLADRMNKYATMGVKDNGHVIVDDVLTTGGSLVRARDHFLSCSPEGPDAPRPVHLLPRGVVVFARGKCLPWVKALFQLPEELWLD